MSALAALLLPIACVLPLNAYENVESVVVCIFFSFSRKKEEILSQMKKNYTIRDALFGQ